jgi:class 3 adenylate cyclase
LKWFLAPQIAQRIVSSGGEAILESHRRDIVVLFCDMRGFTAFSETAEPEDVMAVLREYHDALGPLVHRYEGTLDRFTGDGMLVVFNDPVPCPDPALRAVRLAVEMRDAAVSLARSWMARGHEIGFGVGIAQGYATLGRIGFEGRFDYTAIGTVTNVAARLCAEAKDGQILVTQRVAAAIDKIAELQQLGDIAFKGLSRPIAVLNVSGLVSSR